VRYRLPTCTSALILLLTPPASPSPPPRPRRSGRYEAPRLHLPRKRRRQPVRRTSSPRRRQVKYPGRHRHVPYGRSTSPLTSTPATRASTRTCAQSADGGALCCLCLREQEDVRDTVEWVVPSAVDRLARRAVRLQLFRDHLAARARWQPRTSPNRRPSAHTADRPPNRDVLLQTTSSTTRAASVSGRFPDGWRSRSRRTTQPRGSPRPAEQFAVELA